MCRRLLFAGLCLATCLQVDASRKRGRNVMGIRVGLEREFLANVDNATHTEPDPGVGAARQLEAALQAAESGQRRLEMAIARAKVVQEEQRSPLEAQEVARGMMSEKKTSNTTTWWQGRVGKFVSDVMTKIPNMFKNRRNPDGSKEKWWHVVIRLGNESNETVSTPSGPAPSVSQPDMLTTTEGPTTTWHWHGIVNNHEDAASMFADQFKEKLVFKADGRLHKLGEGGFGVVYLLEGDKVLKLGPKLPKEEAIVAMNLPETHTLLRVNKMGQGKDWTGEVMPFVPGELTDYGTKWDHASPKKGLQIAADLAVGIHTLHTKVKGYALMHCDMTPANSGWYCEDGTHDCNEDIRRSFLLDFGLSLVLKLDPGENVSQKVFTELPRSDYDQCRNTLWDKPMKTDVTRHMAPFSGNSEWRQLGVLLLRLTELGTDGWEFETYEAMYKHVKTGSCDYLCSTRKALKQTKLAKAREKNQDSDEAKMINFIEFLLFDHDKINDELEDVLGHPSFQGMSPSPLEMSYRIPVVEPSAAFLQAFSDKLTRLPAE